jgi:hypothetical protein
VLFKSLSVETADGDPVGAIAWRPLVIVVATVAGFGWALPQLGLIVAIPSLVVVASLAGDEHRWTESLANAAVLTVCSWAIFVWGLNLTMPLWPPLLAGR